jgi:hypothetical protein
MFNLPVAVSRPAQEVTLFGIVRISSIVLFPIFFNFC